jgi:hypothetical protein
MVAIDPRKGDFYREVIEQRILHKSKNKPMADFLKVLANSGSYGLFVEVNTETNAKAKKVRYFSGEKSGRKLTDYVEKPGAWYFPPVASLITSGGRLLLGMLEKCVRDLEGSYLFCDTDSLCIVGSNRRQLRHWEHGGDPSMLDPTFQRYDKTLKLVVASKDERNDWRKLGVRKLMRVTKLSQKAISSILDGKGVRKQTMAIFRTGIGLLRA